VSFPGIGLIKVYFHPGATTAGAIAQMTSVSQTVLRLMPPGIQKLFTIEGLASPSPLGGKVYLPLVRDNHLHLAPVTLGYADRSRSTKA